jgi:hypothetical protein
MKIFVFLILLASATAEAMPECWLRFDNEGAAIPMYDDVPLGNQVFPSALDAIEVLKTAINQQQCDMPAHAPTCRVLRFFKNVYIVKYGDYRVGLNGFMLGRDAAELADSIVQTGFCDFDNSIAIEVRRPTPVCADVLPTNTDYPTIITARMMRAGACVSPAR